MKKPRGIRLPRQLTEEGLEKPVSRRTRMGWRGGNRVVHEWSEGFEEPYSPSRPAEESKILGGDVDDWSEGVKKHYGYEKNVDGPWLLRTIRIVHKWSEGVEKPYSTRLFHLNRSRMEWKGGKVIFCRLFHPRMTKPGRISCQNDHQHKKAKKINCVKEWKMWGKY